MNKLQSLSLITGIFNGEEAKDMLMNMYLTKIRFHEMKDFSFKERFGRQDDQAITRIAELKIEIEKLMHIISEATNGNEALAITSEINIKLLDS